MNPITVLLADDHDVVRKGMKMLLEDEESVKVIGEASDGLDAIEKIKALSPNVVILDLTMPKMTGIEAAKIISEEYPEVKILIFSMHNNREYIINSVENGASGYLLKDTGKDELMRAINVVAEGRKYFPPEISEVIIDELLSKTSGNQPDTSRPIFQKITPKEKQILEHIVQGYNSREIADKLFLSIRTVDNHRANMMKKTKAKNTADLVKMAIG
ncbi:MULTISPECIES: response regulator transcription factor [Arcicella]|uniref:Response regulator transcription factor n=1 Tax=Arcicella aquatica TaxID=217141 RepID=A0ABU5QPF4_9BACT|nr:MULTISPECIES: response regulator transcription factor [Arcicella]MDR6564489.1 DNA-binding NarL/FixJ family response regulator [Arcicella sp. BE51]MDR6814348.1 DNA-binding NarL/FixJ family response regulator [Arcicella sp. BE140]MDR6825630.1 DNA-binding NarL/FixJ family response regulator [Arcicella sp. BE139]MEA5258559.1 response regulator transcription factor [Arcicella aquatica]